MACRAAAWFTSFCGAPRRGAADGDGDVPVHRPRGFDAPVGGASRGDAGGVGCARRDPAEARSRRTAVWWSRRWVTAWRAAFASRRDAVDAAVDAQLGLGARHGPRRARCGSRMGLHTGEGRVATDGRLREPAVEPVCAADGGRARRSGGGLGRSTSVVGRASAGSTLVDLGEHRLRDLTRPRRVFQVVRPELVAEFPPLRSLDALPGNLPRQMTTFVGRETR